MKSFLKVALYSLAAAGAAVLGWRFVRAPSGPRYGTSQPPEGREPSTNGDLATGGAGPAGELTKEQREILLEELEDQIGA